MTTARQTPGPPAELKAMLDLALREHQAGRLVEAAAAYHRILVLRPDIAEAHHGLGNVLRQQGQFDESASRFEQALALRPDYAEAYYNLGITLWRLGRYDSAVAQFERAIALRPDYPEAHFSLGTSFWFRDKFDEAVAQLEQAVALKPDYAAAHHNLAAILRDQLRLSEARQVFERLQALEPDSPMAQFGLATCYLVDQDYERGWPAFEARLRMPGAASQPDLPRWRGEPLAGRTLLLLANEGLGDAIQFVRFARIFKAQGARVIVAVPAALGRILASCPDVDGLFILGSDEELPYPDFYLPLLSSPGALRTDASTIPRDIPYLSADPELVEKWRQELSGVDGFKIGIVWQGSRGYLPDRWRSIALTEFAPLARLPGVRLISLQKGYGSEQVAGVDFPVLDFSDRLDEAAGPFMDTAALIRNLDLVVAPDTAIAHLAGALGAPVWLALQLSPDWRWLRGRDDSPWYPTMRLFRQTTIGEWPDVIRRMAQSVQARRSEIHDDVRSISSVGNEQVQRLITTAGQTSDSTIELDTLYDLAMREQHAGRFAEAAEIYRKILATWPGIAEVHNNLGTALCQQGQFDEALPQFEQAIALKPDLADAHNSLGNLLRQQGKLEQAVIRYEQALALRPDYVEGYNNLGNLLRQQGQLERAVALFEHAIALRPDYAEAHNNLGNVLWQQGKRQQAVARFEHALSLRPDLPEAHYSLGIADWYDDKFDQAVARFEQAIALRPDYAEAHNNLGSTLREQFKLTEARQAFERLLALRPDSANAQLGLATCYLLDGDYDRGWPAFEGRLRLPGAAPQPKLPRWEGQPLAGRTLLLIGEEGFGDTLQFIRYARVMKQRGARIVLAAQMALGQLLASHPDLDELYLLGSGKPLPRCDFYLPLLSAAGALLRETSAIPCDVPYISADPELMKHWRQELAQIDGFKIGIVWQGSRDFLLDRWRSFPLAHFAPLAQVPGVRLISLQKGFGSEQIAKVDFPVLDLGDRLDETAGPFMDTAAVIRNLDLVVAPDSGVVHLAGALGAPVWAALQYATNWRWLRDRDDSPWYPTARLFRQTRHGAWPGVFERMAKAVQTQLSEKA
jgi:tetratricopeptide (TPR) repeat protein